MPVVMEGVVLEEAPSSTASLFQSYPRLKEASASFALQPPKVVGPVGLLYVQQREYAATLPHDKNVSIVGSENATTCIIVVLRHTGSGAVCVAHVDSCGVEEGIGNMVKRVQELSHSYPDGRLEVHLAGGFQDTSGFSKNNALNVLHCLHKQHAQIELVTACICELNSVHRSGICWPKVYGLAVNAKSGEIFPAAFPDKGPEMALRSTRHLTGSHQMLEIYDYSLGLLRIGPFTYDPLRGVDLWLEQGDDFILRHLSTSPDVEPADFVLHMRATLRYIQEHPFPSITIFPNNRPHFYRRDEHGLWVQCHGP